MNRRTFIQSTSAVIAAAAALPLTTSAQAAKRKMRLCLTPGSIGVSADQRAAIELAHTHGFEAVEPYPSFLAGLNDAELDSLLADLRARNLTWGAAGLPVDFRRDEQTFRDGIEKLSRLAGALKKAGGDRMGTWLMPGHNELTYMANMKIHATRLREAAAILKDHGIRLGLEYVGTPTLRNSRMYPFVHTLAETKDLIHETGADNIGIVLDSWHWWTAGEDKKHLLTLTNRDVVSVDLNDAPAGIPVDEQQDGQRTLPMATGVIPMKDFLEALMEIGYDGPVRPEPFNRALNDLPNDEACAATIAAMKEAMKLIGVNSVPGD